MKFCYEYSNKYIWAIISLVGFNPIVHFNVILSSDVIGAFVGILGFEFGAEFMWKGNRNESV
jgi:hypothetical protein